MTFLDKNNIDSNLLHIGNKLLSWYKKNARDLPFRQTKDPYKIWICEIVFQQTRINQGLNHYNNFIRRFPDVQTLAEAEENEVLLYWKGLGYYSRAINVHKAAQQVMNDYDGVFPSEYEEILKLKGVGKYTAAAITSICFDGKIPAVDGNFYRVLSRIFADDFDISNSRAFAYFSELATLILPENVGDFNQAMMDLGSEICKPKNPLCGECPLRENCLAYSLNKISEFPVKTKKVKSEDLHLKYYFVHRNGQFLVRQRKDDFIWKKLFEFPVVIPEELEAFSKEVKTINHKLTHKNLTIEISNVEVASEPAWNNFIAQNQYLITDFEASHEKSFPKPLENYIQNKNQK
ncbi:A/G-specific adenine glycosylase [Chryseobacterium daecheongense]|uniref:Adenine DNA glycosylase n=1 Tax=Chryseobacterium daecheongense TaxID=192389 RepID=A0A3N0VYE6_9FLAO|nr:A/G-specific adenine glycosylase [Chryseobacterium daecheongense]ROH97809.1 A/G-specific adenine glycosylase [Chryseobacterium daecheongense]TDX93023.1 A/G-specific DNA-adenine glycosylase [Chryseobacterium daecheongense]